VAAWSLIEEADPNVEMPSGFGFLAVMATIVIGMAFSLPAEGIWVLPKKSRALIEFLTLGVTLTLSMFSAMVLWVMLWRYATLELVLLLLSAWFVSVVASLVELKRPAKERAFAATSEVKRLREAAERSGITEEATITRSQRVRAEVAYWLIPVVVLPVVALFGLVWDYGGFDIAGRAWSLVLVLVWAMAMMPVAWRVVAPLPPHKLSDRVLAWTLRITGIIMTVVVALGACLAHLWGFAVLSLVAAAGAAVVFVLPQSSVRIPFMKTIRHDATRRRIVRANEWHATVLREIEEGRHDTDAAPSAGGAGREPIIRLEIFGRRSRRDRPGENS
jgi:hypothetical protein